jgi:hypothetical protein
LIRPALKQELSRLKGKQMKNNMHVHLYQQISDKAFQKRKKYEKRGEIIEEQKVLHCIDR